MQTLSNLETFSVAGFNFKFSISLDFDNILIDTNKIDKILTKKTPGVDIMT